MAATRRFLNRSHFLRAALVTLALTSPLWVSGESLTVSAVVQSSTPPTPGPTKVVFRGIAYPQASVSILENGSLLATTVADPSARFDVEITLASAGTFTFTLFAEDNQGRAGRSSNFTISVTAGTTTTVSGIFLAPTIATDKAVVRLGDTISILGATAPASAVTVIVSSEQEVTFNTTAGSDGLWVIQAIADSLAIGEHNARAKSTAPTNEISTFSNTVNFTVQAATVNPCTGKTPGDVNCDGRVNLVDFSILLFFWKKTNPSNIRADINADGVVNVRDFSIMLFWWTR